MVRFWGHAVSTAAIAAAVASAVPACAHDDASVFVVGVLLPPTPNGNVCTYTVAPSAPMIDRGVVDGALRDNYSPEMLVGSTLIQKGNSVTPNSETARIAIQGVRVQVIDPVDNSTQMNNTVLASGEIEPASGTVPAYSAIGATIMDAQAIAHFTPKAVGAPTNLAVVHVKFFGKTLGGQSVESDDFQFPVDVCFGCLIYMPANAASIDYCAGGVAQNGTAKACEPGQDQPVDCQACSGATPLCCPAANPWCAGTCCPSGQTCQSNVCKAP